MLKLHSIYVIPDMYISYLANGDTDNLSDEEVSIINEWYKSEFPNGCTFDFGDGIFNEPYFTNYVEFGHKNDDSFSYGHAPYLGTMAVNIAAYVEVPDDKREYFSVISMDRTLDDVNIDIQEKLPFTDLDEADIWAEWRYSTNNYTIRPAEQFKCNHEIH